MSQPSHRWQQAIALHQSGDLAGAQTLYEEMVRAQPEHADAINLLGALALQKADLRRAEELFARALSLDASNVGACSNHALALWRLGNLEAALAGYDRAIALKDDLGEAHFNRGQVLHQLNRPGAALASYRRAIAVEPDYAEAHERCAALQCELGEWDSALRDYDRAIELFPDYAEAYADRGNALLGLGRPEQAVASYRQALLIRADFPQAHHNLGAALTDLRQWEASLRSYERAISLNPGFTEAHRNRAMLKLLLGNFDDGWREYEWRRKMSASEADRGFPQLLWLGHQPLGGKTILLYAEQGLGDTLQFCRYARCVAELGATVQLEVQGALTGLLAKLGGVSRVISRGDPLPDVDYQCALLSLPLAFETRLDTIPSSIRYLDSDRAKVQRWQALLAASPREAGTTRIGLAWSGNSRHRNDRRRNIALEQLLECLPPGPRYISLQKDIRPEDQPALQSHPDLLTFGDELHDFSDTAALCECLDLVISVDTSVAHLSCALGKRTWILLPFVPDWRWLLDRVDSPWYPTATLYRQDRRDDWASVLQRMARDLVERYRTSCNAPQQCESVDNC